MPTSTYTPMANLTLSGSASSVTFSSISQAYRDLALVIKTTSTTATGGYMRFNGDSGSNYSQVWMYGNGGGTGSSTQTTTGINLIGMLEGNPSTDIINIMDYSATDKHKSVLDRMDSEQAGSYAVAARWANTAAITSIVLGASSGAFTSGSTFALYGVAA